MRFLSSAIFCSLLLLSVSGVAQDLPELFEGSPARLFQILGPVGAGGKDIAEARLELQRQALKMQADAVIQVRCQSGGIKRDGLNFAKVSPYCKGMGVKFLAEPPSKSPAQTPNLPTKKNP